MVESIRTIGNNISQTMLATKQVQADIAMVENSIKGMESSVYAGIEASQATENAFKIDANVQETFSKSEQISLATTKQKKSITESVQSVERIVIVSEQTVASTEEVASSSRHLEEAMVQISEESQTIARIASKLIEAVEDL